MKSFQSLQEERGEKAFKQAIAMGLKYSGFGYWKDPQTGETKFKTENDTLIPVEADISSEKYTGSGPGERMGQPDGGGTGMQGMQGMMNPAGMLQMPGAGGQQPGAGVLGAPDPGAEQVEKDRMWKPGPDGDTCAGPEAQEPATVPKDTFVGRTNYLKWAAGPDGDNMTTVSYKTIEEKKGVSSFAQMMQENSQVKRISPAEKAYGGAYKPRGDFLSKDLSFNLGFLAEKALANGMLPEYFPNFEHQHAPVGVVPGDYYNKTDIHSKTEGDQINTSVKSWAGHDTPESTRRFNNTSTAHNPKDRIEPLLGVGYNDEALRDAIDLFDDPYFRIDGASPEQMTAIEGLINHLNGRRKELFNNTVRHFPDEQPVDQLISFAMKDGFNGRRGGHETGVSGLLTGHDVSENYVDDVLAKDKMNWNHDGNRNFFLGQDANDAILALRMKRELQSTPQNQHQMHINRKGIAKHFPKMWDASMKFTHSDREGNVLDQPHDVQVGNYTEHEQTDLLKKLKGSQTPAGQGITSGKVKSGGVVSKGLSPEDLAKMNRPNLDDQKHHSFETFLMESTPAQQEAERLGLRFAGYGYYADPQTGQRVARIIGDKLEMLKGNQEGPPNSTASTTDTGNPTGAASGITPADRARQMGLQSDGSGGYIDPSTGQVAARTVNNELVFYSANGGAVSDGGGGEQLTQPSPSWVDPVTGELIMPPAQPESPEEKAAVPDATPALAPASYNGFMNLKRRQMYAQDAVQQQAQQDIDSQQESLDARYAENENLDKMYQFLKNAIADAEGSDDGDRAGFAAAMRDLLNDDDVVEQQQVLFDTAENQEDADLLDEMLVDYLIKQSRANFLKRDMGPRPSYENVTDPEFDQLGEYYDEMDRRGGEGTSSLAGFEEGDGFRLPKEVMDHYRNMRGFEDGDGFLGGREVGEMLMYNNDIDVDTDREGNMVKAEVYQDKDYESDKPQLRYTFQSGVSEEFEKAAQKVYDENKGSLERNFDPRLFAENDFQQPGDPVTVSWEMVKFDEDMGWEETDADSMSTSERKRAALDALKMWKTDILPYMDVGTIVHNNPADEQRARIYTLAGFSDPQGATNDQWGIVTVDAKGEKQIEPLGERTTRVTKMTESYLAMIDLDLNMDEIDLVYEVLLG